MVLNKTAHTYSFIHTCTAKLTGCPRCQVTWNPHGVQLQSFILLRFPHIYGNNKHSKGTTFNDRGSVIPLISLGNVQLQEKKQMVHLFL